MNSFTFSETVSVCDLCASGSMRSIDAAACIVECTACGHRFASPRPSYAEIALAYSNPDHYSAWITSDEGRRRMWVKRWGLVRRYARGQRILDVGAGLGTFLALARADGWQITGTEVSSAAVDYAAREFGLRLRRGQLEELNWSTDQFDVVTLWHVLEHVSSPLGTLRHCAGLLREGGLLVVAVPNDSGSRYLVHRIRNPRQARYPPLVPGNEVHLSHFSPTTLAAAIRRAGFVPELMSVDDHYSAPSRTTEMLVGAYRAAMRVTGLDFGQTILAVCRRV